MNHLRVFLTLALLLASGPVFAQGQEPVQFGAFSYEWSATLDPDWVPTEAQRIYLDFAADFVLGAGSDGINPAVDDMRLEFVGRVDPTWQVNPQFLIGLPQPCFAAKGDGWAMADWANCGIQIFYVDELGDDENVTAGLEFMDLRLKPTDDVGTSWSLAVELTYLDPRGHVDPNMLPVLGAATVRIAFSGYDEGEVTPEEIIAEGDWDASEGLAFEMAAATSETGEGLQLGMVVEAAFADEDQAFDPLTLDLNLDWLQTVNPEFSIAIPAGCFQPRGKRFVMADGVGCGAGVYSIAPNGDITLIELLEFMEGDTLYRKNRGGWVLDLGLSLTGTVDPQFLPAYLGRADGLRVRLGEAISHTAPPTEMYSAGSYAVSGPPTPTPPPPTPTPTAPPPPTPID